jgi:zinc protease
VKTNLKNALVLGLRSNDDEELGKEVLQQVVFAGTPYGHPTLGSIAGIDSITIDDVKQFVATHYTRGNLVVGFGGDLTDEIEAKLRRELSALGGGAPEQPAAATGRMPQGIEVTLVEKDARATAISFGFPIEVTRSHPDYPALYLARTWLGEHRSSMSHLYQRIREVRGMNYGDYAYIEAFPGGGGRFFPPANVARRAQLFEIWIRPVPPGQGHHALRIAIHELEQLVEGGLTEEQFESTREYLSKNVFLLTATQSDQLGYALDSRFYGIDDYPTYMRSKLAELTVDDVNAAIRRHLQPDDLHVVMIMKDAAGMKERLVADTPSSIEYASEKPEELLAEDRLIGARPLNIDADAVTIVPVADVFAD